VSQIVDPIHLSFIEGPGLEAIVGIDYADAQAGGVHNGDANDRT
jgi:hypothetical protein